ncbi:LuxR C-terminal-related transcriptional regulator [Micrococcoides hystricis]|uniref:LuxR C-terminal-related transcriptional regulator n=1 Tax=Micrococcoides hystricis TaxID=1572761 RepID=A0ABV6PAW8_9MICC
MILGDPDSGKTHVLNRISRRFGSEEFLLARSSPQHRELPFSGVRLLFGRYARHTDGLWDSSESPTAVDCFTIAGQLQTRLEAVLPLNLYLLIDDAELMDEASQQVISVLVTQLMPDRFKIVATSANSVQGTAWSLLRELRIPPFSIADAEALVVELQRPATSPVVLRVLLERSDHNARYFREQLREASEGQLTGLDPLTLPLRPVLRPSFAQQLNEQCFYTQELETLSYCALAPMVEASAIEEVTDGGADTVQDLLTKGLLQQHGTFLTMPSQILRNELFWQQPTKLRKERQLRLARVTEHFLVRKYHELSVSDDLDPREAYRTAAGLIKQGHIDFGIEIIENQLAHVLGHKTEALDEFREIVKGLFERVQLDWARRYLNYVIGCDPGAELQLYMMGYCLDISSLIGTPIDETSIVAAVTEHRDTAPQSAALLQLKLASCLALHYRKEAALQHLEESKSLLRTYNAPQSTEYAERLSMMRYIMIKAQDDLIGAQQAYEQWQKQDSLAGHTFGAIALASALAEVGMFEEARNVVAPLQGNALPHLPRLSDSMCQIISTEIEFGDQNYSAAIKAVESLILHGPTAQLISPLPETFIAWYWFEKDHPETARSYIAKALTKQHHYYSPDQIARILSLEADYALSFGRLETAEFHLQAAFNHLESTTSASAVRIICSLVEIKVLRGQREEARTILERIDTDGVFRDKLLSSYRFLRAEALTRAPEEALAQLTRILESMQHQMKEFELGRLHMLLGLARNFLHDSVGAQRDFRIALRLFSSIGAVGWERQAAYMMPSVNEAEENSDSLNNSVLNLLTDEEKQIVQRLQQGWTNREIATEMFLSQRTVEHRLTQLFRKLEVRNRTHLLHKLREHNPRGESVTHFR